MISFPFCWLGTSSAEGVYFVTLSRSTECSEGARFFSGFTPSEILRSLLSLRMTRSEGLKMIGGVAK